MSFLDRFSGFNQVAIKAKDTTKETFITPWRTYEYLRMPFDLMNVGVTFQRAIGYAFRDIMQRILEIYEDDLIVYSEERKDHFEHL